ncbi:MAG TPA: hypothetical protein VFV27_03790 [Nevskiaceae bacterium]|nr:hypothetical protein [Nevskiaceae bacterium]
MKPGSTLLRLLLALLILGGLGVGVSGAHPHHHRVMASSVPQADHGHDHHPLAAALHGSSVLDQAHWQAHAEGDQDLETEGPTQRTERSPEGIEGLTATGLAPPRLAAAAPLRAPPARPPSQAPPGRARPPLRGPPLHPFC